MQLTASSPGPIGITQLLGNSRDILRLLTGVGDWTHGRAKLARLGDVDVGLVLPIDEQTVQLMPHGGLRVMQRLAKSLMELGARQVNVADASVMEVYPESNDMFEAIMLRALSRAASPLAIDLLLEQPWRWRAHLGPITLLDRQRSSRLNRLIAPPLVVLAGPPNVGKSTLTNALIGRSTLITADMPGTTRDYTVGQIDLAGLVVHWHDTPGLRSTDDAIEKKAIELAERLIVRADLLVAMTDIEHAWPVLPRRADILVINKSDMMTREPLADSSAIRISAMTGHNINELVRRVRDALVPVEDRASPRPWIFDTMLLTSRSC